MKFNPIDSKVVLKQIEITGTTSGGVIIPDTTKEGTEQAEVVAVGPGRQLENGDRAKMQVKVGDIVSLPKSGFHRVDVDGEEYYVIREIDIITILEKE